jgi:sphinganine C4-monooxygenase
MASNSSVVFDLPPLPSYTLTPREPLLAPIPDNILALILPIVAYWGLSLVYHFIDVYDLFPQYRLHTPAEVLKRNHVTRWDVVRDVILQQIVQTIAGYAVSYFDEQECVGKEEYDVAVWAQRIRIAQRMLPGFLALFGIDALGLAKNLSRSGHTMLAGALSGGKYPGMTQSIILESGVEAIAPAFTEWEMSLASFIFWYFVPFVQFVWAISVVDTWQYFWHRAMHLNRWLYVKFHSRHHRLYVPYAFGALYNHPVEGFLLDTAGTGVGFLTAMMTTRQSMWFFTMSTIKTVDDHCGYEFPWDPLQKITSNNAAYHDIHHQSWGIKNNFSLDTVKMPFTKTVKNDAYFSRYQTKYRRRREGKTDYYARKRLITQAKNKYNAPKYRMVVRFTNRDIVTQIVYSEISGDKVLAAAYAHELPKYGIDQGLTNWAAAYATGLLLARRVLKKLNLDEQFKGVEEATGEHTLTEAVETEDGERRPFKAFLDVGLVRTSTGNRVFAAMKGASDGGIFIPHSDRRFPGYDIEEETLDAETLKNYIVGGHVSEYMENLADEDEERYKSQFVKYIENEIDAGDLEEIYTDAHKAIREDPFKADENAGPKKSKAEWKAESKKYKVQKLTHAQRKARVEQKIKELSQ